MDKLSWEQVLQLTVSSLATERKLRDTFYEQEKAARLKANVDDITEELQNLEKKKGIWLGQEINLIKQQQRAKQAIIDAQRAIDIKNANGDSVKLLAIDRKYNADSLKIAEDAAKQKQTLELQTINAIGGYAQQGMQAANALSDLADQADKNRLKKGQELSLQVQYSIDDSGLLTPCEDGDYTLNDGRIITVTDGKITNLKADPDATSNPQDNTTAPDTEMQKMADANAPTPAPATPDASTTTPDANDADNSDIADRVTNLESQMAQVLQLLGGATQMGKTQLSAIEKLNDKIEMFSKEPATKAINLTKVPTNSLTEWDEIKEIQKKLSKNSKK